MAQNPFQRVEDTFGRMIMLAGAPSKPMQEIAVVFGSSILENFRQGGIPDKWQMSNRAKKQNGMTLIDSGRLMKSASTPQVQGDKIILGSNLPYARVHQLGINKEVTFGDKMRKMFLPARRFLVLQQNNYDTAGKIFLRFLTTGN